MGDGFSLSARANDVGMVVFKLFTTHFPEVSLSRSAFDRDGLYVVGAVVRAKHPTLNEITVTIDYRTSEGCLIARLTRLSDAFREGDGPIPPNGVGPAYARVHEYLSSVGQQFGIADVLAWRIDEAS